MQTAMRLTRCSLNLSVYPETLGDPWPRELL